MVLIINMAVISQDRTCVALQFCVCSHLLWYMYLLIFAQLCLSLRDFDKGFTDVIAVGILLTIASFLDQKLFSSKPVELLFEQPVYSRPFEGEGGGGGGGLYSNTGYLFVLCQYQYLAVWLQIMVHVQRQNRFLVISILYSFYRYNQFLVTGGNREGVQLHPLHGHCQGQFYNYKN